MSEQLLRPWQQYATVAGLSSTLSHASKLSIILASMQPPHLASDVAFGQHERRTVPVVVAHVAVTQLPSSTCI